jgi:hypothetical protein
MMEILLKVLIVILGLIALVFVTYLLSYIYGWAKTRAQIQALSLSMKEQEKINAKKQTQTK